jgi:hypothetical protein
LFGRQSKYPSSNQAYSPLISAAKTAGS